MRNDYRKLGRKLLLYAVLASAVIAGAGYGILTFFRDGIGRGQASAAVIALLQRLGMSQVRAEAFYGKYILQNIPYFAAVVFCAVFLVCCFAAMRRMGGYLNEMDGALTELGEESGARLRLSPELAPYRMKLEELLMRLENGARQARNDERRQKELVVGLAHDLRTPLTSVTAYLAMLDEHPDMPREERVKYTHISLEKAIRLGELINEFFDITRYNLQDMTLEKKEFNLSILLEQLADESYGMLSEKTMFCEVDVQEDLLMRGDPDKLARVFDNLLRNAAAYGYDGTPVRIQARGGDGRITVIFTNEGPQIPQQKLELIFERFYRVDAARSSRTGGAGIGLAIAKQVVELHGGEILATSDSRNTRFIVTLPAGEDAGTTPAEAAKAGPGEERPVQKNHFAGKRRIRRGRRGGDR